MTMKGETVLAGAPHPQTKLQVMESPAGFYIGFADEDGAPYTRETVYFGDRDTADQVLSWLRYA